MPSFAVQQRTRCFGSVQTSEAEQHPRGRRSRQRQSRPLADIHRPTRMLRSQPALPAFAARARFNGGQTHSLAEKRPFDAAAPTAASARCQLPRKPALSKRAPVQFVGILGHSCAACIALIMRAFSNAITLWAANICASRVLSSEKGRTVWR